MRKIYRLSKFANFVYFVFCTTFGVVYVVVEFVCNFHIQSAEKIDMIKKERNLHAKVSVSFPILLLFDRFTVDLVVLQNHE